MDLVREVLKNIIKQNDKEDISIEEIVKVVAGKLNVKITDVKSQKKNKNLALCRQIAMYLARKLTTASFPDIGDKIGGRDHSTVIYANNKIKKALESNQKLKQFIEEIEETLLHRH